MADNFKDIIPTFEFPLDNDEVVVMYKYLTTAESREIQRMILANSKVDVNTGKMQEVKVETFLDIQDKTAGFVIKEVRGKDQTIKPYSVEWLGNLPVDIGNKIYEKVNEISQGSQMTKEEKKTAA